MKLYSIWLLCLVLTGYNAAAQRAPEGVIQIDGVIMTADSLRAVSDVTVEVKNQDRGVESGYNGVFTIVCYKGDTLQFSCIGFRPKEYVIPSKIDGQYFSLIQLMVQDTFYLPETIIRPLPTREEFDYAFIHWRIPDDKYEIARRNTDAYALRMMAYTLPHDGREAQHTYQNQQAYDAMYYGQQKPYNILNVFAWNEFFEAWKRGDFRNKNNPYSNNSGGSDY